MRRDNNNVLVYLLYVVVSVWLCNGQSGISLLTLTSASSLFHLSLYSVAIILLSLSFLYKFITLLIKLVSLYIHAPLLSSILHKI